MPGEFTVATLLRSLGNEDKSRATMNEFGMPVTMGFLTYMSLLGRVYQIQLGTEDAPIDSTTSIDDALVWAVIDVPAGVTIMPVEVGVNIFDFTTGTIVNVMLEVDNAKVRYTSGGTAFTALNLNTGKANASGVAAYVGTDITVAAKTADGSLEISRQAFGNDALAAQTFAEIQNYLWTGPVYPVLEGPASFLIHFGAATADVTGYGMAKFIELS